MNIHTLPFNIQTFIYQMSRILPLLCLSIKLSREFAKKDAIIRENLIHSIVKENFTRLEQGRCKFPLENFEMWFDLKTGKIIALKSELKKNNRIFFDGCKAKNIRKKLPFSFVETGGILIFPILSITQLKTNILILEGNFCLTITVPQEKISPLQRKFFNEWAML